MNLIKLGAASINQTPLDWDGNKGNIISAIKEAHEKNVNVLVLPELCVTGYGCEDSFFMPDVLEKAWDTVEEVADFISELVVPGSKTALGGFTKKYEGNLFLVAVGCPVQVKGSVYNCTVLLSSAGVECIIPKRNLCSDGIHYESRWFKSWKTDYDEPASESIYIRNRSVKFGDVCLEAGKAIIGVEICEDAWVANRPGVELTKAGVNIIINPSASHFSFGKDNIRKRFIEEGSRAFKSVYVYSNLLGNESGRVIYDGDTYIAANGRIIAQGTRFSFNEKELTTAVVNLDKISARQFQDRSRFHNFDYPIKATTFSIKCKEQETLPVYCSNTLDEENKNYKEFSKAISLGLWDYMCKSWSKGFVLSLSGGADSSAVAWLVWLMVKNAFQNLGKEELVRKLNSLGIDLTLDHCSDLDFLKHCMSKILTCVYQGTRNSSKETENSARDLANAIGASFSSIIIEDITQSYTDTVSKMIGRDITWEQDDIALQNIQARVRSPSVWMVANIKNALLLSTSNRSEAAVGYATMDGDTSGGLSPIAGASKDFIINWLRNEAKEYGPASGLLPVVSLKPSAELRPQDQNQTDEDDLMPYNILNEIELMFVRDKMSPKDIYNTLLSRNIGNKLAIEYTVKFFKLFSRNQWKRERYAPSFHVDDESLDPKTFFRFPILNSGFKKELNDLEEELMEKAMK